MHQVYFAEAASQVPYTLAFVELDEGPTLIARLVGSEPVCEMPVHVVSDLTIRVGIPIFAIGERR
jgi:uncharacterized OB-fold protein